jgi:predicted AAA+ superfamily ATPase
VRGQSDSDDGALAVVSRACHVRALARSLCHLNVASDEAFCWATHGGAELDLLLLRGGKRLGFEFKFCDAPRTTKSMHVALEDLQFASLFVVYPGDKDFALDERIQAVGLPSLPRLATAVAGR